MDSKIYNISNIKTKKLNSKMLDFLRYLAKTNNTIGLEISERFNISKKTRYDRIKKLEGLNILNGVSYIWNFKALGYWKELYLFVEGIENKSLIDTGIIIEIVEFPKENTSFVKAELFDENEEKDFKEAIHERTVIYSMERLL